MRLTYQLDSKFIDIFPLWLWFLSAFNLQYLPSISHVWQMHDVFTMTFPSMKTIDYGVMLLDLVDIISISTPFMQIFPSSQSCKRWSSLWTLPLWWPQWRRWLNICDRFELNTSHWSHVALAVSLSLTISWSCSRLLVCPWGTKTSTNSCTYFNFAWMSIQFLSVLV